MSEETSGKKAINWKAVGKTAAIVAAGALAGAATVYVIDRKVGTKWGSHSEKKA